MENFTNGYAANRLSGRTLYHPQARKSLWLLSSSLLIGLWISLGWLGAIQAQTNLGGIINTYAPVTAVSGNNITIGSHSGAAHTFAVGDYVLIAQMTGNTNANAGNYDMRKITAMSGSVITVDGLASLAGRYDTSTQKVQLVHVPFDANGFVVTNVVTPLAWNGTVGGIVTAYTPGTLNMNANISADQTGFGSSDVSPITGSSVWYGGGGASGPGWRDAAGGGGGLGSGGGNAIFSNLVYQGTAGTYTGGQGGSTSNYGGAGNGGGGGVGSSGGGGGGAEGAGGGGGASLTAGGCGNRGGSSASTGGLGSANGTGDTNGSNGNWGGGGGGGGAYVGGGGGSGFESYSAPLGNGGKAGSNGGLGGINPFTSGGNGGGSVPSSGYPNLPNNYFTCTGANDCSNLKIWMGGGSQSTVSGGGIVLISAGNLVANNKTISAKGGDGIYILNNSSKALGTNSGASGSGGGGGGLVVLNIPTSNISGGNINVCVNGGNGKSGEATTYVSGGGGGGGGSGVVKLYNPLNSGTILNNPPSNVVVCAGVPSGGSPQVNPKTGGYSGGGGCGGAAVVYTSKFSNVCNAGITAPTLSTTTKSNVCPTSTVDLNSLVTSTCPTGYILDWHTTNTNLSAANQVSNVATSGTYYVACFDQTNNCYSVISTSVTVKIYTCTDLSIVKMGSTAVTTNGILSYTLVINNNGPIAADSATVTDANVANFTSNSVVCSAISGGASCPTLANLTIANLQTGTVVIPTLPNGGSVTLTVTGTAGGSGTITNTAIVTPAVGIRDSIPANNTSTATTTISKTCSSIPTPLVK